MGVSLAIDRCVSPVSTPIATRARPNTPAATLRDVFPARLRMRMSPPGAGVAGASPFARARACSTIASHRDWSDGPPRTTTSHPRSAYVAPNSAHRSSNQCFCGRVVHGIKATSGRPASPVAVPSVPSSSASAARRSGSSGGNRMRACGHWDVAPTARSRSRYSSPGRRRSRAGTASVARSRAHSRGRSTTRRGAPLSQERNELRASPWASSASSYRSARNSARSCDAARPSDIHRSDRPRRPHSRRSNRWTRSSPGNPSMRDAKRESTNHPMCASGHVARSPCQSVVANTMSPMALGRTIRMRGDTLRSVESRDASLGQRTAALAAATGPGGQ